MSGPWRPTLESEWRDVARNAAAALSQDPNDHEAMAALNDARNNIRSNVADMSRQNAQQRRFESGQANDPNGIGALVGGALEAPTLGLGGPIRGAGRAIGAAVRGQPIAPAFRQGLGEYEQAVDRLAETHPAAFLTGGGAGTLALGAGTALAANAVPAIARGMTLGATGGERALAALKAGGIFGAQGVVRGATQAHGGTVGERAVSAGAGGITDFLLGAVGQELGGTLARRHSGTIAREQVLRDRAATEANRRILTDRAVERGIPKPPGPDPLAHLRRVPEGMEIQRNGLGMAKVVPIGSPRSVPLKAPMPPVVPAEATATPAVLRPMGPALPVGEPQMPNVALHATDGTPIPGTSAVGPRPPVDASVPQVIRQTPPNGMPAVMGNPTIEVPIVPRGPRGGAPIAPKGPVTNQALVQALSTLPEDVLTTQLATLSGDEAAAMALQIRLLGSLGQMPDQRARFILGLLQR